MRRRGRKPRSGVAGRRAQDTGPAGGGFHIHLIPRHLLILTNSTTDSSLIPGQIQTAVSVTLAAAGEAKMGRPRTAYEMILDR